MAGFIKRNGKIAQRLTVISVLPLLALGAIIMILGYYLLGNALEQEIKNEMENTAKLTKIYMDIRYPGDIHLQDANANGGVKVLKGDADITAAYGIVEEVAGETGMEISFYYWDTCILTTITDKSGVRAIATGAADQIQSDVLRDGKSVFYPNTRIFNVNYYSFYMPVTNENDEVVGMISVAKPTETVTSKVRNALIPLVLVVLLAMVVMIALVSIYTKGIIRTLNKLNEFTARASAGDANVELDQEVVERNDELGEMGGAILSMHRALRDMMERDPLTKLYNRRSADRRMAPIVEKFKEGDNSFSVAIGDIDFFKKVNDTYGHDAGDAVLVHVAQLAQEHMRKNGFVARWGGEEFLFVFDKANQKQARKSLEALLDKIRELEVIYGDQVIRLTMSYGVIGATEHPGLSLEELIRSADDRLYHAKKSGRNRVVAEIIHEDEDSQNTNSEKEESDSEREPAAVLEKEELTTSDLFLTPEEVDRLLGGVVETETAATEEIPEVEKSATVEKLEVEATATAEILEVEKSTTEEKTEAETAEVETVASETEASEIVASEIAAPEKTSLETAAPQENIVDTATMETSIPEHIITDTLDIASETPETEPETPETESETLKTEAQISEPEITEPKSSNLHADISETGNDTEKNLVKIASNREDLETDTKAQSEEDYLEQLLKQMQ